MNDDYQVRVIKEKEDLDEKLVRLNAFLQKNDVPLIPEERERLLRQEMCMKLYSQVLGERIGAFV